ncbi:MAG: conjugative transposon protein TraN [Prevotella sp.]|nr:conjugative transposon protein TraN [Prevotella sp.]
MNRIAIALAVLGAFAVPASAQKKYGEIRPDTARVRYVRNANKDDSYILDKTVRKNVIYVNEEVTTHIIMPENIKLVDISTDKIVGNQCADNIVRIKPAGRMYENELAGTITVIGERHLAQFDVIYTPGPAKAYSVYNIQLDEMKQYVNPDVLMPQSQMAAFAWAIYCSGKKFNDIHSEAYGIQAVVNNIFTVNDYFFIDFSLYNKTRIKYDIDEIRIKLTDKKEAKATNSQTIELSPVYSLNRAKSFQKGYRNVIVIDKLTFPDEKILRLEISEDQISGRVIYIPIEYEDILNADSFDKRLVNKFPFTINSSR